MRKRSVKAGVLLATAVTLQTGSLQSVWAADTYTMTYRAGAVAVFDRVRAEEVLRQDGFFEEQMEITDNYIKLTLERGAKIPDFSQTQWEACVKISDPEKYFILPDANWEAQAGKKLEKNEECVLDYGVLVNPVEYQIQFVDTESKTPLTAPIIGYGNEGDRISYTPLPIEGYTTQEQTETIKLKKNEPNKLIFSYKSTLQAQTETKVVEQERVVTTTVPGRTVIQHNSTSATNGTNPMTVTENQALSRTDTTSGRNQQEAGNKKQSEEVKQESDDAAKTTEQKTPSDSGKQKSDITIIKEEEVPKTVPKQKKKNPLIKILAAAASGVALLAASGIWVAKKRKKRKQNS
ncbi:MAG: hypothetical protein ACI4HI_18115 [Lachnospiraceae bacterium]